jgi:hypothetical protein
MQEVLKNNGYTGRKIEPRFFTQGSWAYKTLNRPCHTPPQQSDVDDGAYLPLSIMKGTSRPSIASAILFSAAEKTLEPLVLSKHWKLITDKPTCIRVEISNLAHIDIPLYSIPDEEFVQMQLAAESRGYDSVHKAFAMDQRDSWSVLPTDKVLLAHREKDWIQSDPRPVKDWFVEQIEDRGEQLRRVVRYLKAFRDKQWSSGGPSSILLMAAATPIFENRDGRDDLALLDVVAKLPEVLRDGVVNPVDTKESLTERLGVEEVEIAAKKFEMLHQYLSGSIHATDSSQACLWMRDMFGSRFPNRPDLVKLVSVAATISATPAQVGPNELVGRTKAG